MILPTPEFVELFKKTPGALSVCESIAIMNIAAQAPQGLWLEMGTYKGKSAMSAAYGGNATEFRLIEPLFETEVSTGEIANRISAVIKSNISIAFIIGYSTDYLRDTNDKYSYVFSDAGSHADGLPMAEVKLLEDRIVQGGVICFHDWGSQFKEVKEASDYLVSTGKYEYMSIDWGAIIGHVREGDLEKDNDSWHHIEMDFPCFVGAVKKII